LLDKVLHVGAAHLVEPTGAEREEDARGTAPTSGGVLTARPGAAAGRPAAGTGVTSKRASIP